MPYINSSDRKQYDESINDLVKKLDIKGAGDLNYIISALCWRSFTQLECYQRANDIIGALEGAKLEFYRRRVAPYEDGKIESNGDVDVECK